MKIYANAEINFDSGTCEDTIDVKLPVIAEKLRFIKNPWTGNKRKLIVDLFTILNKYNINFDSMLDLFSGSAMVSMATKLLDKQVVANDLMTFAYFNAKAFVSNNNIYISDKEFRNILHSANSNKEKCKGFVFKEYHEKKMRFTKEEALFLDSYKDSVIKEFGSPLEGNVKSILSFIYILHYVMNSCFVGGRLNSGQVLAQLDHRLNHQRNNGESMSFSMKSIERPTLFSNNNNKHYCYNQDAIRLLAEVQPRVDIAYIDPPYGGSQSDYAYMYAFFEEYIYGRSSDKLDHLNNTSDFSKSKEYYDHFVKLLKASEYIPVLVFSYNDSSWCKIDDIEATIKDFRRKVIIEEVDYSYRYRDRKNSSREFVIIAE